MLGDSTGKIKKKIKREKKYDNIQTEKVGKYTIKNNFLTCLTQVEYSK